MRRTALLLLLLMWPRIAYDVEHVEVPDVCGFVSVQTCVAAKSHIKVSRLIHVRPSSITAMSNPVDSPSDCIKLHFGAREIYVVGTYDEIAGKINKAQTEHDAHSCK